jgi:hypothetical protein
MIDSLDQTSLTFHLNRFKRYFHSVQNVLGDILSNEVDKAVGRVISNIDKVGSHHFQRTACMCFVGTSIVEGTNVGIKRGMNAAKASMNLDVSGCQMLQQEVDHHSHKRNVEMAQGIHRHKHWSRSLTRDALTTYQECLAVKNFDSRKNYVIVQKSEYSWWVMSKAAIDDLSGVNVYTNKVTSPIPHYYCIRTVAIDCHGFLSCTCCYSYHYLSPCRHMMAVLNK